MGKINKYTLPETNSSHLKVDGWKHEISFWDGLFSGANPFVLGSVFVSKIFILFTLKLGEDDPILNGCRSYPDRIHV